MWFSQPVRASRSHLGDGADRDTVDHEAWGREIKEMAGEKAISELKLTLD